MKRRRLHSVLLAGAVVVAACTPLHRRIVEPPRPDRAALEQSDALLARAQVRRERFQAPGGPSLSFLVLEPRNYQLDYEVLRRDRLFSYRFRVFEPGEAQAPVGSIMMLHGWSTDGRYLLPWAMRLAGQGYRVIVPDLRNHGRSGKAAAGFGTREAEDVLALARHLHGRGELPSPVHLFGISYGAVTVLHAAARWNDDGTGAGLGAVVAMEPFANAADAIRTSIAGLLQNAPHLRWHERALRSALRRRYGPDRVERAIDDTGALLAMDLRRFDVGEVMQQVRACVLHVHGRVDTLIPVGTARALAARRSRNVYLELPEDGHFSTTARADWLAGPLGFWLPVAAGTPADANCPPVRLPADPAGILPAEPTR
jgi:pimeloyl-ACP methyl ester carboxylesterase